MTNPKGGFPHPGGAPVANFTVSDTAPIAGEKITLTDESTNNPQSWSWTANSIYFSTEQNPSYYCDTTGPLTIGLTVINQYGTSSTSMTYQVSQT